MKMHVLDNGKIYMIGNNTNVLDAEEGGEAPSIPIHSFLLETEDGLILFDTGCDPKGMTGNWPDWMLSNPFVAGENGNIVDALKLIGKTPDDVKTVVMSHLHCDHAGGLMYFPNAEVIVHENELAGTLQEYVDGTVSAPGNFHMKTDVEAWIKAGIRWRPVSREITETKLAEGVTLINLGFGHTYGMLGLVVELKEGTFLLASDSANSALHYGPPARMTGVCMDEKGYYETIERVRFYENKYKATVLFGHDSDQFNTLKKAPQGYYE